MSNLEKIRIQKAVKIGMAMEETTLNDLAEATGKDISTLSVMLKRANPTLNNIVAIFNAIDAKVVIKYRGGHEVELTSL